MLKEAIEKIVSLAAPTIREIEGSVFRITQDGDVSEIHAPETRRVPAPVL